MATDAQIRAQRLGQIGAAVAASIMWIIRGTWRRIQPAYWGLAALTTTWIGQIFGISTLLGLAVVTVVASVAAGLPTERFEVRAYRITVVVLLGLAVVVAIQWPAAIATIPGLTLVLGWPWWHHHRSDAAAEVAANPDDNTITEKWAELWRTEVVGNGLCKGTRILWARSPRPYVVEAQLRIMAGGAKLAELLKSGPDVDQNLDLDEGSVGFRRTGKAARPMVVIVERSYITNPIPYKGATWDNGRFEVAINADGTPGHWTAVRDGYGALHGLAVGSTGAGKSRTLGVVAHNCLSAQIPTIIGDPQGGSLPKWKDAASEYHSTPETVANLILRVDAEVTARGRLLGADGLGMDVIDVNDPRVIDLGIGWLYIIIDECQLVLLHNTKEGRIVVAAAYRIMSTARKYGVGVAWGTQLPQLTSLGNDQRIRDAAVAGNLWVGRLSNKGSKATILPDDFVGDPMGIPESVNGKTTAGTCYLRSSANIGMRARTPLMDEAAMAAACPRTPVRWLTDPITLDEVMAENSTTTMSAARIPAEQVRSSVEKLSAVFGIGAQPAPMRPMAPLRPAKVDTPNWVLRVLAAAPQSTASLLDRPDCPVQKAQLYAVLNQLADTNRIVEPGTRGGAWRVAERV